MTTNLNAFRNSVARRMPHLVSSLQLVHGVTNGHPPTQLANAAWRRTTTTRGGDFYIYTRSQFPSHVNLLMGKHKRDYFHQLQEGNAAASMRTAAAPPLGVLIAAPTGCSVEVASSQRLMVPEAPLGPSPPTSRKLLPKRTVEPP